MGGELPGDRGRKAHPDLAPAEAVSLEEAARHTRQFRADSPLELRDGT